MAKLEGQKIADSYEQLLHTDRDGGGNGTTLVNIKDGKNDTTFALQLATDKIQVNGSATLTTATSTVITAENTGNSAVALNLDADRSGANQGLGNINFKWNGTAVAQISGASGADTTNKDDGQIQFSTMSGGSSSVNMTLDKDGNVGIGTASPERTVHIMTSDASLASADANVSLLVEENDHTYIELLTPANKNSGIIFSDGSTAGLINYDHNTNAMTFGTNDGATDVTISSTGNVGIKNASPEASLDILNGQSIALQLGGDSGADSLTNSTRKFARIGAHHYTNAEEPVGIAVVDSNSTHSYLTLGGGSGSVNNATHVRIAASSATNSANGADFRMIIDANSRISLSNNDGGANNTTFGNLAGAALTTNGNRNSLFGHLAGNDISSGQENTLMGYTAGEKIATGLYNTAIGSQSFVTNVDGDFNTAIGYGALYSFEASNNAEGSNTIVGANASFHLDSGQYNTMVGTSAGESSAGTITYQMNVGVGYKALFDLTTGDGNVAIGSESASNLTIGNYNISIGKNTLITEGVGNGTTAVGNGAGGYQNSDSNNEATGNSLFGFVAGEFNVTGTNNTYIGYESGKGALNQSNSANTGLGYGSLKSITTGNSNTAIGAYAMQIATTATVNTAIGGEAMSGITTGAVQDAVAVGYGAFKGHTSTSTGTNGTVAIGRATLFSLTTGDKNTAIGYKAMTSQTTGARNTVIGYEAMFTADGGEDYNTIIGSQAGYYINNDASHDNVIIGKNALQGGTGTILGNVAIGSGAMDAVSNNNQTGVVAIGNDALGALTSGASNTAIGYQSGLYLTTGGSNTYVGYEAGKGVDGTPQTGGNNVAIGQGSGVLLQGSATSNTFVGTAAGDVVTTGTNNVIIGTLADPNTATGTNQTVIGYNAVGQGDNVVVLGDANVTHVCLGHEGATAVAKAAGFAFPATQVASANANTLDDYEEGTWTPTFRAAGGSAGSVDATGSGGSYTKIGRQVHIRGRVDVTNVGSYSGNIQMGGIPFTAGGSASDFHGVGRLAFVTLAGHTIIARLPSGGNTIDFAEMNSGGGITFPQVSEAQAGGNTSLIIEITYYI